MGLFSSRKSHHEDSYLEQCHTHGRKYDPAKHVERQMKDHKASSKSSGSSKSGKALGFTDWLGR